MTHSKAVKIILSRPKIKRLYQLLMAWNESETIKQNAFDLKIRPTNARMFQYKYSLNFKPEDILYRKRYFSTRLSKLKEIKISNWDSSLTLEGNAKKLGISYYSAVNFSGKHQLPYTKKYKSGMMLLVNPKSRQLEARKKILALRKEGLTLEQIGKIFGVTRERIRQIEA